MSADGAPVTLNDDQVFQRGAALYDESKRLLDAVVREHRGAEVTIDSVLVTDTGAGSGRTYVAVAFAPADEKGTRDAAPYVEETYSLDRATGAWALLPAPGSAPDEQAARAFAEKAYPGYSVVAMPSRNAYGGDGAGLYYYAVLQSRTVPGFRWVLDIPEVTGGVSMSVAGDFFAPKNRVRGDAFARAWVARHPGTLVWEILCDDDTGEYTSNTLEVSYYVRADQVTSVAGQALRTRFAYDPKRRTWTERP